MPTIYKPKKPAMKRTDEYDAQRRQIYNSAKWRKLRDWKFANSPLCELCLKEGKTTPSEDVHHIISFMSTDNSLRRLQLAYDYNNLLSVCKVHHQLLHCSRCR